MNIPTAEKLEAPILHVLHGGGPALRGEIRRRVAKDTGFSEKQIGKGGKILKALRQLQYKERVELKRKKWAITEAGRQALPMEKQPGKKQPKDKALTGRIGESRVVSELGRRGISATGFSGNIPVIDVVAYRQGGATCSLQVKAWMQGSMTMDAKRYLSIRFEGDLQFVDGLNEEAIATSANVIFVFVSIGETAADDRFFILRHRDVAEKLCRQRTAWLAKKGNRLGKPRSTLAALNQKGLAPYEDNWGLIEDELNRGSVPAPPEDRESYRKWLVGELGRLER